MPMEQVMKIFDETNAWNLPVVDEQGKYIGFVSKSKIFTLTVVFWYIFLKTKK